MSAEQIVVGVAGPAKPSNGRAVVVVLLAFALFSATDAMVKLLAIQLPVPQVTLGFTAGAFILLCLVAILRGEGRKLVPRQPGLAMLRAILIAGDTLLIHYAFAELPLSEAYLIAFLSPIIVAVLSFALLGERLSRLAWAGVVLGFAGVAIALKPGVATLGFGHAAAFGSAILFALSLLLLRRVKAQENDEALLASLFAVMMPLALVTALLDQGIAPVTGMQIGWLLLGGVILLTGHGLLVRAFRLGEAAVVAPFQYSQIIWGCAYGALLFAAPIEFHTLAGAAIIIISGWLVLK